MTERVLIVGSDVESRDFLYELISGAGFGVATAPSGSQAVEHFKKERFASIFIDVPLVEGAALARQMREFDSAVSIVLFYSPREAPPPSAHEKPAVVFIKKDFQDPEVIKAIFSLLKSCFSSSAPADRNIARLLIVDDESENRAMLAQYLMRRGYDAQTASSGEEAIEKMRQGGFEAVLLDVTMGGMDGLLTLRRLLSISASSKVIMVSAVGNREILEAARDLGAADYLIKPFNLETLEATLVSVLFPAKAKPARFSGLEGDKPPVSLDNSKDSF